MGEASTRNPKHTWVPPFDNYLLGLVRWVYEIVDAVLNVDCKRRGVDYTAVVLQFAWGPTSPRAEASKRNPKPTWVPLLTTIYWG